MKLSPNNRPFELNLIESTTWEAPLRKSSFLELIYVQEGDGFLVVNQKREKYKPGNLFIIQPLDEYTFELKSFTRFCLLRFTKVCFSKLTDELHDYTGWFNKLEMILTNFPAAVGCIINSEKDRFSVKSLVDMLIREYVNQDLFFEAVIQNTLVTLLQVVARNVMLLQFEHLPLVRGERLVIDIINYIQAHIYKPEKLQVKHLAEQFYLSTNYLGEYFRKHTGRGLKEYIQDYKVKVIEMKLIHSNLTIAQMADQLHFTDESHLNKTFKQFRQITPKQFRDKNKARLFTPMPLREL